MGEGKGQGQGVVTRGPWPGQIPGGHPLQGGGFGCGGKCSTGAVPGNVPGYHSCAQASRRCPATRVTLGTEELWGLVALGHPVGAEVGSDWGSEGQGAPRQETIRCLLCQGGVSCHHSCLEGLGHSSSPGHGDLTWCW